MTQWFIEAVERNATQRLHMMMIIRLPTDWENCQQAHHCFVFAFVETPFTSLTLLAQDKQLVLGAPCSNCKTQPMPAAALKQVENPMEPHHQATNLAQC